MRPILGLFLLAALAGNSLVSAARADAFGSGVNAFSIEFVAIGNPGNPADTTGFPNPAGSVSYQYRIGRYEISEQMIDKANALGALGITKDSRGPNKPVTSINWYEAARFVNWLNSSTGSAPAYKFDNTGAFQFWGPADAGYNPSNEFRNNLARYFLPSIDEWYKAAYYDPQRNLYWDYPTASNLPPTPIASGTFSGTAVFEQLGPADITQAGGSSPYGTIAQGGNVTEWMETDNYVSIIARSIRGGAWAFGGLSSLYFDNNVLAYIKNSGVGFRVAGIVPEPAAVLIVGPALFVILNCRAGFQRWRR